MTKKIIIINAVILILVFVPAMLFRFNSHYKCKAGVFGQTNKMVWEAKASKYKNAAAKAIDACKKQGDRPDRCDVLSCENYFF